ncbi:Oidioi.mRNA.OKI2018_I69.chr2.g5507.t2.cds [Oikopleura dioica]|uniref:Oidioi.mRNA.OKI2018_I69.chr2.g5507.t2.cds n=1 Tax=Oikopleura dioica TaxID=34765 RepID=A0ABN7T455_OIKDI|nr:Oidioi.mRNA.OKI2018_I69.chr2.g5507.t2.cds [Oikopleura dioica]
MPDLEEFGEDEDEDDEWEVVQETHCHLELPDCPVKLSEAEKIRVVGLDSEEPFIQVNNIFFKGNYEKTLGTTIFFDGNSKAQSMVGQEIGKTERKLLMKEVHLIKRRDSFHEAEREKRGRFRNNDSPPPFLEKESSSRAIIPNSDSESEQDSDEDSLIEISDGSEEEAEMNEE